MLHGIREGVVALDAEGRIRLVNDEAQRLLDLPGRPPGPRWTRSCRRAVRPTCWRAGSPAPTC
ncbi:PAS domain-containing protein [Streptomyces sp. M19]